ncbi:Ribosomal protein L18e/L15 superfamily protein [Perilla frutescens var. hirtella]|nr:Ribosomal protein L18e/L15 superfamily protein [Perilla frutescens var. hirtella]
MARTLVFELREFQYACSSNSKCRTGENGSNSSFPSLGYVFGIHFFIPEQEKKVIFLQSHFNNLELVYIFEQVSRVTVRVKAAVEAAGGSVRRVYYNKLGFRALLKPEWFEKKGRLLPKAARPPPKLSDKVDSIGRLPAPTKPIPFVTEEKEAMSASTEARQNAEIIELLLFCFVVSCCDVMILV